MSSNPPPPTSPGRPTTSTGGRPTTSTGRRPGTANPFRALVEQQQQQEQAGGSTTGPVTLPTLTTLPTLPKVGGSELPVLRPTTSTGLADAGEATRPGTSSRNPFSIASGAVQPLVADSSPSSSNNQPSSSSTAAPRTTTTAYVPKTGAQLLAAQRLGPTAYLGNGRFRHGNDSFDGIEEESDWDGSSRGGAYSREGYASTSEGSRFGYGGPQSRDGAYTASSDGAARFGYGAEDAASTRDIHTGSSSDAGRFGWDVGVSQYNQHAQAHPSQPIHHHQYPQQAHPMQSQLPPEEYEEEDESSDDEDVFAFLPPSTAEVEEERRRREEEERRLKVPVGGPYGHQGPYGQTSSSHFGYGGQQQQQQQMYGAGYGQHPGYAGRDEGSAVVAHLALLNRGPALGASDTAFPYLQPSASTSSAVPPVIRVDGEPSVEEAERERRKVRQDASFAFVPEEEKDVSSPTSKGENKGTSGDVHAAWEGESPTSATGFLDGQGQKRSQPPTYDYAPPVSPPSTESNSNDGSRAGQGGAGGGFRMTRLDRRRKSGGVDGDEAEKESVGKSIEGENRKSALTEDESVTVAASVEGTAHPTTTKQSREEAVVTQGEKKEEEGETEERSRSHTQSEDVSRPKSREPAVREHYGETPPYPQHYNHFQPNPARHNPNSGPYKRHREYHYNQAWPQYATARAGSGYGGTTGEAGPSSAYPYPDSAAVAAGATGVQGARRRRRKKTPTTPTTPVHPRLDTADTRDTARTSEYGGGSEYDAATHGPRGYGYEEDRPDTGLTSLGYRKREGYGAGEGGKGRGESDVDEMYEDEYEDEYYEESREGSIKMEFDFDAIEDEDSPYPEVRASVSNIDDPDMPAMTIRMWVVGLILCMASSAVNVFFNFRSPAPSIVPLVLLLLSYPIGKFLAFTLPITTYRIPLPYLPSRIVPVSLPNSLSRVLRPLTFPHAIEFSLNPGPWNIKEHVLVYIMANVAVGSPYALNAIVVLEVFYGFKTGYWFSLTLVLATQLTGFGLAGMCRRFLVWPASMVWPQNLVACTLLNTLHAEDEDDGIGMLGGPRLEDDPNCEGGRRRKRGMSRYRFFVWTTLGSFVFFFLPGYLFEALSIFSFVCWAAPENIVVNQLFGVRSGLGMSMLTFDWSQITWIGSPLMVPWWAEVHVFAGFVLFYWIMTPILYYTNSWQLAHFPISDTSPYDRFGNRYQIDNILNQDDTFDLEAYEAYSPLFLPATYAVTYLLAFCLSTCVIVHTILYHGHTLLNGFKKIRVENDDIHAKLMRNYPEVPDWWYLCAFAVFFALAIIAVEVWDTSVPVWALLLSVALPIIYILPSGFIYAMTGQGINLNILAQIIPGTLLPGKPLANMIFKSYSVQTLSEATNFVQDLKLGHYVKVPPRATFLVQMIATTFAAFIQVGVKHWIFTNVPDICNRNQPSQLTCPHNQVFFTASAVWGLIGPTRQFGKGSIYHPHLYAIVVGVFLPVPFWLWRRRYPNSWVKWVSTPVVLNGVSWIPPATGINYSSWFMVGFMFQYIVRKRNFAWWSKFNYVLSSALDSGTVIAIITIFFTLQFPRGGIVLKWWGNEVHKNTTDYSQVAYLPVPEGGITWQN